MGTLLLHNPWLQFHLLYVGTLSIALIWDRLRNPSTTEDGSPAGPAARR